MAGQIETRPYHHDKVWTGVPWAEDSRIPAKTMRERITEQQAEIDYLTNQLKIIKAGDKAQTTSEKHANSDTGKDKSSFSSRKVVDMTAIAEVSAFRVAFDEHKLPLMLGNPEKLVSAIDKKLPKNKEIKEWGKPPQPPQHREPGYELETQEEFLRRQQQWDFNRETLIQRWHTKKENIMQACSAFRSEYVSVEQENFRVVVTAPVPRKMRPHIVWKFPEGFSVRNLDFKHYLPLFLEGLAETEPPYDFVAVQGVRDLVALAGRHCRLLSVLPYCAVKIKGLLKSDDPIVFHRGLETIKLLMSCDRDVDYQALTNKAETEKFDEKNAVEYRHKSTEYKEWLQKGRPVGRRMSDFFKQLVPPLAIAVSNAKFSRTVDQLKPESHLRLGVIGSPGIIGCLQEMEKKGGPGSFLKIKPSYPDYSSCLGGGAGGGQ